MNFKSSSEDIEPYLVDVLAPRQKRTLNLLIAIWFIANLSFLAWWVQPSHYTDLLRFSLNTLVIFWITIVPIYYFYFLRKMTKPNPAIAIPQNWRVAMVTTRVPAHEPWEVANKCLLAMLEKEGVPHDDWIADADTSHETIACWRANRVKVFDPKHTTAYH